MSEKQFAELSRMIMAQIGVQAAGFRVCAALLAERQSPGAEGFARGAELFDQGIAEVVAAFQLDLKSPRQD
ncbi:hypothetical protein [Desulfovibrio sp.]|uniref:hypothetical protein n=1 Tax=Desulfovibrio sp. TaxID=885 RepID=UPI0025C0BE9D|nr:hypothetical protein [Desulfovibrio sp.]